MKVRIAARAKADIEQSTLCIATDNPSAARRWFVEIQRQCAELGEFAERGAPRSDVRPGLRTLSVRNFLILYRLSRGVEVVRVIHGARHWEDMLRR